eukprot:585530-Rhodomonas_salina.1
MILWSCPGRNERWPVQMYSPALLYVARLLTTRITGPVTTGTNVPGTWYRVLRLVDKLAEPDMGEWL